MFNKKKSTSYYETNVKLGTYCVSLLFYELQQKFFFVQNKMFCFCHEIIIKKFLNIKCFNNTINVII